MTTSDITPATALYVGIDGTVRELNIGSTLSEQSKVIGRALLDHAEAIDYIHRPGGTSIVALARAHRSHKLPNLYAALAVHALAHPLPHIVQGPVVFAGYTATGDLTAIPDDDADTIRDLLHDAVICISF
ncbi:hypothetical protein AB0I10_27685 [Streptomyces sp. NPDC050636]|uniref:hypothetical protein n=1 Tax=Streptomyces sp. NPDC050636 TaxID=3154510 RepID=UPI0034419541